MQSAGLDQVLAFFCRPQGRIGRLEYSLGIAFIYALSLAMMTFVLARMGTDGGALTLAFILTLPLTIAMFIIVAKRCHDIGLPGTFVLLLFVPLAGLIWLIALFFIPGTPAPNAYGAAPQFRRD